MELSQTPPGAATYVQAPGYFRRLQLLDWLFAVVLAAGAGYALQRYGSFMDVYEQAILVCAVPTFVALGWHWKPVRWLMPLVAVLAFCAIALYGGNLDMANKKFFLKYMLSSQSAILWMSTLFVFSMFYIRERRLWIWIADSDGGSEGLMAMSTQRKTLDFEHEFNDMTAKLAQSA